MRLLFDKDILIAIVNRLFILVAVIYGTNTLTRRNQMRKYNWGTKGEKNKKFLEVLEILWELEPILSGVNWNW